MATLQEYIDVAPTVMGTGDFSVDAVEAKLASIPSLPEPAAPPKITKTKVVAIFNTVFEQPTAELGVARAGGFGALALENGLTPRQVKTIVKELQSMIGVYRTVEEA